MLFQRFPQFLRCTVKCREFLTFINIYGCLFQEYGSAEELLAVTLSVVMHKTQLELSQSSHILGTDKNQY